MGPTASGLAFLPPPPLPIENLRGRHTSRIGSVFRAILQIRERPIAEAEVGTEIALEGSSRTEASPMTTPGPPSMAYDSQQIQCDGSGPYKGSAKDSPRNGEGAIALNGKHGG